MPALKLSKHHGWGNDFLVLLDLDGRYTTGLETMARALCDRHTGVGADGLIRVAKAIGADLAMELVNADGSRAEMSGNGIRCLAQAAADAGLFAGKELRVRTDGGVRELVVHPEDAPGVRIVDVDMGPATIAEEMPQESEGRRARRVDIGNPHLVLVGPDPYTVAVTQIGADIQDVYDGGMNVEFVMVGPGLDEITMRVWERGVGETRACGTGASAAAAAVHAWGLVGRSVSVRQPGGTASVELRDDTVILSGPTRRIAEITVDWPERPAEGGAAWF